ncbi:hypothetical protein MLD38_029442 [Melastoma candidum]|uniref:Uncharacterized protein n=1 Tax=Melastoma candidum TaxID=119954 RepID=A0ACB9N445_9MYRT|nr:hypothetical protein MLD38_029442 [Melastoma candidum]
MDIRKEEETRRNEFPAKSFDGWAQMGWNRPISPNYRQAPSSALRCRPLVSGPRTILAGRVELSRRLRRSLDQSSGKKRLHDRTLLLLLLYPPSTHRNAASKSPEPPPAASPRSSLFRPVRLGPETWPSPWESLSIVLCRSLSAV